ncbi:MAG: MFS transporter [Vitreoscilla sp.]|nr:MFS transporter [Vitreoscilla sp.]
MSPHPEATGTATHPAAYLALFIPFGVTPGFLSIALAYQLNQAGMSAGAVAGLIALSYLPHTWKVLWAPLVDTSFTRKRWYLASNGLSSAGIWGSGVLASGGHSTAALTAMVFVASLASTLVAMAIDGLMSTSVPDAQRGRASGWAQAGNLGGVGLGGGLALWLMQSAGWGSGTAGALLAVLCLLCGTALWAVHEPPRPAHTGARPSVVAHARALAQDVLALVRSRPGTLALVICFLPIGSGAAGNMWSVVADRWHASADTVAWANGAVSGLVSALGCLAGGWLCDRMDRRTAYCIFGLVLVSCALAMAAAPRTSLQFVLWLQVYAFGLGLSYAAYSAVVLEAIGRSSGATKFSLLASLANMPIAYVTVLDGWAYERWGATGMLLADAASGLAGVLVFLLVVMLTRKRHAIPAQAGIHDRPNAGFPPARE